MPSQMANLAVLMSLLLLPGLVVAQVYAPDCSLTWGWTFNSLGQNACTVAAYLMATCSGGSFTISSLMPGYTYSGPSGPDDSNLCKCSTVAYSLISACDACQGSSWISWDEYTSNCTSTEPPSTFPNPVPSGTLVPAWALLDVTANSDRNWSSSQAFAVGDTPEVAAGAVISPGSTSSASTVTSGSSTAPNPSTTSPYPTPPSPSPTHQSNAGAIAGGVVGGIAAASIAGLAAYYYLRRRRRQKERPSSDSVEFDPSEPHMGEAGQPPTDDGTPIAPMKLYDPNDPTTFPGYQPTAETLAAPGQVPILSHTGAGNTLANMQTAQPQGYHGLPTV
ncbi:hypothetical protein BC827DRAFT_827384 [Russula dissimulans]|nr:hypothetical protein BC827DRAFT_827384 [Russula dissimulans]